MFYQFLLVEKSYLGKRRIHYTAGWFYSFLQKWNLEPSPSDKGINISELKS